MSTRIAIVGGGYVGIDLATAFDDSADVTLIEPRSHFVHTPAMIRAVVDPSLTERALIPYDKLLTHGRVVQARAVGLDAGGVTLEDGTRIEADLIVVGTGSSNASPFKPDGDDIAGLREANRRAYERLKAAKTVGIIGAGAVGTELAGEIAHAMPDKEITLISDEEALFPKKPDGLGKALARKLRKAGVRLILGQKAENLESTRAPFSGELKLSDGSEHRFDLIFPVLGAKPISGLLEALPDTKTARSGRVEVDPWLRPSPALPNVFALGDVAETGDGMTVVGATRQLVWLKATLKQVMAGRAVEDLLQYAPWGSKAPILIPLGPKRGNSFLGLFTVGNFITRMLKGEDLFIKKYQKMMNRI
ncbi:NAD(P)/FAD-dependent oxidoreductase [Gymnodinialimonas ceratoperidinii]|uniref:FAD-dependent oxidoreductase n=1 Tax=Gymnodinialimonas ceratoperidinii TaxID=2856823 RepID=A0A8F6TWC5_9RHOB|nr:FAD-dependent oxidoreductase [Gymnodinialimonas ceratoperidinii]QXT39885.1 FAD-dependent oxidoreductase [Gymnodinialimonas ceratoperidinii]